MIAVLNKRWLSMGWRVMDPADSEPMALVFIERLKGIPYQHYDELAQRAGELRARRIEQGLKTDDFSADMMLAAWPALRQELHEWAVKEGRTLTATSQTQCRRCFGTGMEQMWDGDRYLGVRPGCKHEHVDPEPETTGEIDEILANVHKAAQESAADICKRLRLDLVQEWAALPDGSVEANQVWQAMAYLSSVERHCRANLDA